MKLKPTLFTNKPQPVGLTFFRDALRQVRWSFKAPNGRILADSGEGYRNANDAIKGWLALMKHGSKVKVAITERKAKS